MLLLRNLGKWQDIRGRNITFDRWGNFQIFIYATLFHHFFCAKVMRHQRHNLYFQQFVISNANFFLLTGCIPPRGCFGISIRRASLASGPCKWTRRASPPSWRILWDEWASTSSSTRWGESSAFTTGWTSLGKVSSHFLHYLFSSVAVPDPGSNAFLTPGEKGMTANFFFTLLCCCFGVLDPRSGIRDG